MHHANPTQPTAETDDVREAIRQILPEIVALRHDLHAHPELSGSEERTAGVVSEMLTRHGIAHRSGIGGTFGVVATLQGGAGGGKTLALRGDMDALPIQEESNAAYRSQVPGVMHACGHDGHTANLMGAALVLNRLRESLSGQIDFIFQPAEETVRGADALVAAGVVDNVDAILMLHGWPQMAVGRIGVRSGAVMASADGFELTIRGKGGHAAYPHNTIDPIYIGTQIVTLLQSVVAREISPVAPAVVSVTKFHAGTAYNVIPQTAELAGTVRTLDPDLRETMPSRLERIIGGVCAALRAEYTFAYHKGTPVTVNDPEITDLIRSTGREVLGAENVIELAEPSMGAEDFAYYLEKVPGAMFRLGVGCPSLLHTPGYDFGDGALETGMLMLVETARRYLAQ